MAASINDKLTRTRNGARPSATTVTSPRSVAGATLACGSLAGWPTASAVHFITYKIDSSSKVIAGSQCDWKGIIVGTNITNLTLQDGTDAGSAVGDVVEMLPTAAWGEDLIEGLEVSHNRDGSLVTAAVQTALAISNTATTGFTPVGATPTYVANNGNKEYTATFPADVTSFLRPGSKLAIPRTVTPPTQAMSLTAASSQYATKASPTGITFTSAFTCEAWVYLNSYTSGTPTIVGRYDGSNGWYMQTTTAGQVQITYATGGTFSTWTSYQSLPLKRWVHVAASVSSTTSKTLGGLYINGVSVPNSNNGLGAANLAQGTGPLQIGALNALANNFFDGYISEARVWSVAQSQAQIQANMNISLTGSETNLVALFQGNGNFNDKTANANNLTATGGAVATQLFSTINGGTAANPTFAPMNATEFFVLTSVGVFSGGVTPVTMFGGTECNLPNAVLGAAQYSYQRTPYGFPASKEKWIVDATYRIISSNLTNTSWAQYNGHQLSVPTGEWELIALAPIAANASATATAVYYAVSNSLSGPDDTRMQIQVNNNTSTAIFMAGRVNKPITTSSQISYYGIAETGNSAVSYYLNGSVQADVIYAECAYI